MINPNKSAFKQWRYRPLLVTALIAGNVFQLIAPALADGTAAGTGISNTATGTYADPNDPNTTINATSNTVTVTVAKVAGITVTKSGVKDYNSDGTTLNTAPSGIKANDILKYDYTVTNVGNSPINFRIPNAAAVSGPGTVTGNLQISYDGGATFADLPPGELITTTALPLGVPVGGSVLVRVAVTVQAGANTGDTISVKLGGTPGDAQNVERTGANSNGGDVFTVDSASIPGGAPINNTRTAAATQQAKVGTVSKNLALATILKTRTGFDSSKSTDNFNNDLLTYGLSLRVEQSDLTNTGITPAPLVGTAINVDGATTPSHILVSDAIPANTTFTNATAPTGWKVVYTTSPINGTTATANSAAWSVTKPTTGTITRIGFINDTTAGVTSVAPGATVTGFTVQVTTNGIATTPTPPTSFSIANIAQVFGQTSGDNSTTPALVYDDSGDQNPDDYHGSTPPTAPSTGVTSTSDPVDTGNNNTATTATTATGGGADNVYTITPAGAKSVLNGPNGAPNATGPSSNNDDFTNKSALIPPNQAPGSTITPGPVSFTNTVQNTGTAAATISLVPTAPTNKKDLAIGATITLTYNSLSASYIYNGTDFAVSGVTPPPLQISNVAAGATANYGVEVKLPLVALSTDSGKGYSVPITAANTADTDPTHANTTIDRVYTGFLRMVKQSQVLQGTGSAVGTGQGDFNTTPGAAFDPVANPNGTTVAASEVARTPAPGNIIEYRIVYTNISDKQSGSGNIILNASNAVITEDGNGGIAGTNNWALDNDKNGVIDTSNVPAIAKDSGTGNVTFFSGNPATTASADQTGTTPTTDVTKYVDTVTGNVAPGQTNTFGFRRKVN